MIRNPIPWPDGNRCAVALTFDVDADSILHLAHREAANNKMMTMSMLRYDIDVAVPRLVDMYRGLGLEQTFFLPAWCIERYPAAVEEILKGGQNKGKVWFAKLEDIAAHVRRISGAGSWRPRVDRLPYYPGPITELRRTGAVD